MNPNHLREIFRRKVAQIKQEKPRRIVIIGPNISVCREYSYQHNFNPNTTIVIFSHYSSSYLKTVGEDCVIHIAADPDFFLKDDFSEHDFCELVDNIAARVYRGAEIYKGDEFSPHWEDFLWRRDMIKAAWEQLGINAHHDVMVRNIYETLIPKYVQAKEDGKI